jgi:ABC-type lipoprotein release transport system permease subunit
VNPGLEVAIAWRYLLSRRSSRRFSFITFIAMGGVVVGVSALVVILGVMNGLQTDLREKILIASPDLRVLTYGEDLKMTDWRATMEKGAAGARRGGGGALRAHAGGRDRPGPHLHERGAGGGDRGGR